MHIVIIGNGISGITAARHIRKLSDHKITVISGESDYFFSRTALMYIYMGHMRFADTKPYQDFFWEKNRINLLNNFVEEVKPEQKRLLFADGTDMEFDKLIIAVGSKSNKFGWPGQDLDGVHGLYHLQDLEAMERHSQKLEQAVIVGGGLIGIEMAEMFHSRHIPVTFLVREKSYWNNVLPPEESEMVSREIRENGIDLQLETELKEIWGDREGRVKMVLTSKGEKIKCGFVGLTAGVSPNIDFLQFSGINLEKGVLVNAHLQTNFPDIYAIGDCAQLQTPKKGRRPIEAIWYTGRMMGETVAHHICGNPVEYDPGIWFNSAKFMDIEYMVYGDVPPNMPENYDSLYWEHPDGKKSIRLVWDRQGGHILGFNLMGVRFRHEVCEKWIREKTKVEEVLQDLKLANFDPEFHREHESAVLNAYADKTGTRLHSRKRRNLKQVLNFLRPA
ncbi:MAG: NAD(P)/FAD-dependent oxidoreductase [Bacteroidetes bacterium]|nr:NAD(P)/FAD-dependent oxidoreductase [Bacteroidota bacterium]